MPQIVVGNCSGTLALAQARSILAELNETWPDISIVQRTITGPAQPQGQAQGHQAQDHQVRGYQIQGHERTAELLTALADNRINIAVQRLDTLPLQLPEGLVLGAVSRRLEVRTALIAADYASLQALPERARIVVTSRHEQLFVQALRPDLEIEVAVGTTEDLLARVLHGELAAALIGAADLIAGGWRERVRALLEPQLLPPPAGRGALGFVVREGDDLAGELAYTLQHRPSYDRALAERAFVGTLVGALAGASAETALGAFATVSDGGELNLLGATAGLGGERSIRAEVTGEASQAEALGRELARDMLEQLTARR